MWCHGSGSAGNTGSNDGIGGAARFDGLSALQPMDSVYLLPIEIITPSQYGYCHGNVVIAGTQSYRIK
jgi:hypothetical protein